GAAAGVFAVVGGKIVHLVLGAKYGGEGGRGLGHLVAYLSLWMVGWVAVAVAFPLVFVSGRQPSPLPLATAGFLVCIPLGLGLRALWGLAGIAIAIGLATLAISSGLLYLIAPKALAIAALGLGRLALAVGGAAALAFGGLALALSPVAA